MSEQQWTCYFTGAVLDEATREEHVIPRSLGGRIRSRKVSCSAFNENCGGHFDNRLFEVYSLLMATLGPCLASEHQVSGIPVNVPGDSGKFKLDKHGSAQLVGSKIVQRDPVSGVPTQIISNSEDSIRKIVANTDLPQGPIKFSYVPITEQSHRSMYMPSICKEAEVSAMKCAMLAFDEACVRGGRQNDFSRAKCTEDARDFVRRAVETRTVSCKELSEYSIGLQYDRIHQYAALLNSVDLAASPFDHVLIVSGNSVTKALDVVWWILSVDPFGFRISREWSGDNFTMIATFGVLRNSQVAAPVWLESSTSVCNPTPLRACPGNEKSSAEIEDIVGTIRAHHFGAYRDVVDYVEHHADEFVVRTLFETAATMFHGDVKEAMIWRISQMYRSDLSDSIRTEVSHLVNSCRVQRLTADDKSATQRAGVLSTYRDAIDKVKCRYGLPGHIYEIGHNTTISYQ